MIRRRAGLALVALVCLSAACQPRTTSTPAAPVSRGTIVASIRAEPRSFNAYATRDLTSQVVSFLTQSSLVRINRVTQELEPELAERWTLLDDGVSYRVTLREGLSFSDGAPFSSADVVFSFKAIYGSEGDEPRAIADSLHPHGKDLVVEADGPNQVVVRFPAPFGPGMRLLDGVPILPRHRLEASLESGTFAKAWGLATKPDELAGLGPFVLQRYEPGQRLTFDRNPRYWRRDSAGAALPAAEHVVLEVVPDQDTELLRLEAGALDFTQSEIRPADYAPLKAAQAQGRLTLTELGVGQDGDLLWFNLQAGKRKDPRAAWLQSADFRRAVSAAVDRDLFVSTVYLGAGVPAHGLVSPGNQQWFADAPAPRYDVAAARARLASLGLRQKGDVALSDAAGTPVRFTLLTQKGNTALERGAAVIRESLAPLGIQVDVVATDVGALVERFMSGDYDAVYFRLVTTSNDPTLNAEFWLSSGGAHVWNPAQEAPATAWEREIDQLMGEISTARDHAQRRISFEKIQQIVSRELPALCFAFPRLWVAMSNRVAHATPAPSRPPVLWNPAEIAVRSNSR